MTASSASTSLFDPPLASFPLRLRREPARVHPPAAWFIPGDSAEVWLEEMTGWNVPLAEARLYVVPASLSDRTPCGLLFVPGREQPARPRRAIAYAAIGDRLYLPADARLEPDVAAEELRAPLPYDVQVLHPTAGLVGFGPQDALSVEQLLMAPGTSGADWTRADPGLPPLPRLTAVRAEPGPGIEQMLQSAQGDIGSESPDEAPYSPNESPLADAAGNAVRATLGSMAAGMGWLLSQLGRLGPGAPRPPGGANRPGAATPPGRAKQTGPIGRARRKLAAMSAVLQSRRHRELNRLLSLLQRDPDAGLRFALPLRDMAGRGVAPPGDHLAAHDVDFRWKTVFGGGHRSDAWDVPADLQRKLREQYWAAANRETRLGRHRRAAYIYCHLLGQFSLGVVALVQGRHFHEAALIYRDKLNNLRAAADCLANGGLLSDAIPLYVELEQFVTAGDLHGRLEQHEQARACYREATQRLMKSGDILNAARLLETRLSEPDEALGVLAATWPGQDPSGACLEEWFAMAGRLGRHDAGLERVRAIRGQLAQPAPLSLARESTTAITIFSCVAGIYPADGVRAAAADATRVLAGPRLRDYDCPDRATIVKAVIALAPADRLLARDGQRFLEQKRPPKPGPRPIPLKPGKPLRAFALPLGRRYRAVATLGGRGFLVLGSVSGQCAVVARAKFDGWMQTAVSPLPVSGDPRFLMLPPASNGQAVLASMDNDGATSLGRFSVSRVHTFDDEIVLDMPPFFSRQTWSACHEETHSLWVLQSSGRAELILQCMNAAGVVSQVTSTPGGVTGTVQLATRGLTYPPLEAPPDLPVPMVARSGHVYVGLGSTLLISQPGGGQRHIEMPHPIRSLVASPPFTVVRIIATLDEGAVVVTPDGGTRALEGMTAPRATFTRDGLLIAVDAHGSGRIYRSQAGGYTRKGSFQTLRDPLAVIPASGGEFAVIGTDGRVEIWEPGAV